MIEDTKIEKRLGRQLNCVKAVSKIGIYSISLMAIHIFLTMQLSI